MLYNQYKTDSHRSYINTKFQRQNINISVVNTDYFPYTRKAHGLGVAN